MKPSVFLIVMDTVLSMVRATSTVSVTALGLTRLAASELRHVLTTLGEKLTNDEVEDMLKVRARFWSSS